MNLASLLAVCLQCLQAVMVLSESGRSTRDLSMLRLGKRDMGVRSYLPPLVPPSYDLPEDVRERQLLGAPRMGKDIEEYDLPHYQGMRVVVPHLPRLGNYEEYMNEIRRDLTEPVYNTLHSYGRQKRSTDTSSLTDEHVDVDDEEQLHKEKRALPRFGLMERDAEAGIPFPRLGLRDQPFPRLGLRSSFPRLGLRDEGEEENNIPFPRLGLRDQVEEENNIPFPRLGLRDSENDLDTRALPRFGLRDMESEKRAMSMLRMGKRDNDDLTQEKRKMSMLRMGKRAMSMLRMGKRNDMSMLRMGRSQLEGDNKRAMSMLRMGRAMESDSAVDGKRAMSMLRMGRSMADTDSNEEAKRAMSMLRMGKRNAMSMLRMGRSYTSDEEKRAMSMLRMGRGMSMLRMGRSSPELNDESTEKRKMSMLRMGRGMSMLRMGKRSTNNAVDDNIRTSADDQPQPLSDS